MRLRGSPAPDRTHVGYGTQYRKHVACLHEDSANTYGTPMQEFRLRDHGEITRPRCPDGTCTRRYGSLTARVPHGAGGEALGSKSPRFPLDSERRPDSLIERARLAHPPGHALQSPPRGPVAQTDRAAVS